MEQEASNWKQFCNSVNFKKSIILFLILLISLELIVSQLLPHVFPHTWYLKMYLPWESVKKTHMFLTGKFDLELDHQLGWRNRNDGLASKETAYLSLIKTVSSSKLQNRNKKRVVFLGDSRIGGYINLDSTQTIYACMNDDQFEAISVATNLYGLDQTYLGMKSQWERLRPDYFIIGIGSDVGEMLNCHYLPFLHDEVGDPLLKPRFNFANNELKLQIPNYEHYLKKVPDSPELLAFLKTNDEQYAKFENFMKWEFTPILGSFSILKERIGWYKNAYGGMFGFKKKDRVNNVLLVNKLLNRIKEFSRNYRVKVIFLLMPNADEYHQKQTTDTYYNVAQLLTKNSLVYVDVLRLFKKHQDRSNFYFDRMHTTHAANQLIAQELQNMLEEQLFVKAE